MRTITFYSYKGGVGRTLAAANFAIYLAKLGQRTVMVDFDLEAPGLDSKFHSTGLPQPRTGLLDYILEYQDTGADPGRVQKISVEVAVESSGKAAPLWLIPAGDYLSKDYSRQLDRLDWSRIFSRELEGVAFFQQLLSRIGKELRPDFVIVDSRTGISEIAGLCTQQLADEVIMLSSLSSESSKVTRHIKQLIEQSEVARTLGKSVDVKVVVSRVPKPDDLLTLQEQCTKLFDVENEKLFFLFSCPALEQQEFIAIDNPGKDEDLVTGYVRLFYGLNIELASLGIQDAIDDARSKLLVDPESESRDRFLELATLYPHPDAYRTAMRFFGLVKQKEQMRKYGWKLLNLVPDDIESQRLIARSYLSEYGYFRQRSSRDQTDKDRILSVIGSLWEREELDPGEQLRFADMLEDAGDTLKSLEIALPLVADEDLDNNAREEALGISARTAQELGRTDVLRKLVNSIPTEDWPPPVLAAAVELREEVGDSASAFELAKRYLEQGRDVTVEVLEQAAHLAHQLDRVEELEGVLRSSVDYHLLWGMGRRLRELGLPNIASEVESSEGEPRSLRSRTAPRLRATTRRLPF